MYVLSMEMVYVKVYYGAAFEFKIMWEFTCYLHLNISWISSLKIFGQTSFVCCYDVCCFHGFYTDTQICNIQEIHINRFSQQECDVHNQGSTFILKKG